MLLRPSAAASGLRRSASTRSSSAKLSPSAHRPVALHRLLLLGGGVHGGSSLGLRVAPAPRANVCRAHEEVPSYLRGVRHDSEQQQRPSSLFAPVEALASLLRRAAAAVMLAPLLLLTLATPPAAHARGRKTPAPPPEAATAAVASTEQQQQAARPWQFNASRFDPTKLTVLQTVDALLHTPEGQVLMKTAAFICFMWVVTRRPDPAPSKPARNPYAATTKAWLIVPGTGQGQPPRAVEVDPATLPKPPPLPPPPPTPKISTAGTASSSGGSKAGGVNSVAASGRAGANGNGNGNGNGHSNGGSPEPGVIGLGLTAAAIDTFAPLGRFIVSEMVPAMGALSSSPPPSPSVSPSSSSNGAAPSSSSSNGAASSNGYSSSSNGNGNGNGVVAAAVARIEAAQASAAVVSTAVEASGAEVAKVAKPELSGVPLVSWAVNATQHARKQQHAQQEQQQGQHGQQQQRQEQPAEKPQVQQVQAQGATPLKLDPRYPPSRAQQPPRPVSLLASWFGGSIGASGSQAVEGRDWTQGIYEAPAALPDLDLDLLAQATVSSVVALNLALATRQRTLPGLDTAPRPASYLVTSPSSSGNSSTTETRVSQTVAANLAEAARQLVVRRAQQVAAKEAAAAAAAQAQATAAAAAAAAATAAAKQTTPATAAAKASPSSSSSPSPQSPAPAAPQLQPPPVIASARAAIRLPSPAPSNPNLVPRVQPKRSKTPDVLRPASTDADGSIVFTSDQLQAVEVVIEEVRSALRSPSPRPPESTMMGAFDSGLADRAGSPQQQQAVARWTEMIKRSPGTAADAVAEVHAVAQAVMDDVRGSLQTVDSSLELSDSALAAAELSSAELAARAELAGETANAMAARRGGVRSWAPWAWAWGLGSGAASSEEDTEARRQAQRLVDFLDPIKALLSLRPPTTRSKYDPLTFIREWGATQQEESADALPSWDPLQRLRAMRKSGGGGGKGSSAKSASSAAAASGAGLQLSFEPSKYDAVARLWEFLAALPQLVESAEWAAAAAQDPLRLLIADAAGRSQSRVLQARAKIQKQREAAAGGPVKKKRSRWSKYDPLADIFSPEVPLGGRQIWDEVVSEMLSLEAISGPMVKPFSAIKVMGARGGQAFASALLDFRRMAVTDDGASRLRRYHPAISAWLQSASNVSLATVASGSKLGPVWGVLLLPRSNYQATLQAARQALPPFLRELERRHPGLWGLLRQRDPEQALVLLATLAAWVVADSVANTGKPPRALTPPPADAPPASSGPVLVTAGAAAGADKRASSS